MSDQIKAKFDEITKTLAYDGELSYDDIKDALIELCTLLNESETDESTWCIGEGDVWTLGDLIIGAYWHFTEWHNGQYSKSYETLCALGTIFSPGMSSGVEEDSSEQEVYDQLRSIAA